MYWSSRNDTSGSSMWLMNAYAAPGCWVPRTIAKLSVNRFAVGSG
ncbi:Uncharacterised protein [Mycobacteroides abscessus subsp. abscessus]|nr:Uncharacterised protein [Mycobacteroides abscessus subsp. abscessus]